MALGSRAGHTGDTSVPAESGFQPERLAGTSAGAIVATLIAAGYTAHEIYDLIFKINFADFTDPPWPGRIPLIGQSLLGKGLSLLVYQGLNKGDAFYRTMKQHLDDKKVRTFKDLIYDQSRGKDSVYRYKVQVIASDVTGRRLLQLPREADKLRVDPDELEVALAVRMSMSIPFFSRPVRHPRRAKRRDQHLIVDGGMLSNFPVWLFDVPAPALPRWPTIGLRLVEPDQHSHLGQGSQPESIGWLERFGRLVDYIKALVETMAQFHDRLYLDSHSAARTIGVSTDGRSGTNFGLTDADKQQLFLNGQRAAQEFLAQQWAFGEYVAAFRMGERPTRQQMLRQTLAQAAALAPEIPSGAVTPVVPPVYPARGKAQRAEPAGTVTFNAESSGLRQRTRKVRRAAVRRAVRSPALASGRPRCGERDRSERRQQLSLSEPPHCSIPAAPPSAPPQFTPNPGLSGTIWHRFCRGRLGRAGDYWTGCIWSGRSRAY